MTKLRIHLPLDLYNRLFKTSLAKEIGMSTFIRDVLENKLLPFKLPRAANDNQGHRYE